MGITRRRALQAGAGLAIAVAIPAGQHVYWNGKKFGRSDYAPDYPEPPPGEQAWMNWSGIQKATPTDLPSPDSEAALSDFVRSHSGRIRPRGSGHSFSGLVPSEGAIVDVSRLAGITAFDAETGTATIGAGTTLYQTAAQLDELGRAFPNLPDIADQTLGGTFATATHGTGLRLSAMQEYITGFRIVTANGDVLDVSASSNPVLFAAGKVSLGALGIISAYRVKTAPAFNLRRVLQVEPIDVLLDEVVARGEAHRNFEFFYLPGTGIAASLSHDVHNGAVTGLVPSSEGDDELLQGLKDLRGQFGWWPWLRRRIAQAVLPNGVLEDVSEASWKLLATTRPVKFNEMEYHIPLENGVAALRETVAMMDQRKHTFFPMEVRFVAQDSAWLSPFHAGPCLSIAIHAAVDESYDYFFSDFEPMFRSHGGRPHWGKLHSLTQTDCAALYPRFAEVSALRESLDPEGTFLNPHLAALFGEAYDGV